MSTQEGPLRLTRIGPIGMLRLARPDKRNALNAAMLEAWPMLLHAAARDDKLQVLLVSGGAGLPFSAGADIEEFQRLPGDPAAILGFSERFATAQEAMAGFAKPTIAMISGACVGGGCGLALGCDLRFADQTAKFGVTPAKLGLDYSIADTRRLVDAVGYAPAADLLLSGRLIGAEEALTLGLVTRVFEPAKLEAECRTFALAIAANAPSTLRSVKAALRALKSGAKGDDPASRQAFLDAFNGPDFAEGLAAFREKRPPQFGRSRDPLP